jgi:hypothetical protein
VSAFEDILNAGSEDLLKIFYRSSSTAERAAGRSNDLAARLGLKYAQLICGVGFNPLIRDLPDITTLLGFESYDALARERNEIFIKDIYRDLGIRNVLSIYARVSRDHKMLDVMQYLLKARLESIEKRIEETVNSMIIERYKKEMKAIYNDGVAQIDFVEYRLSRIGSGFRALLNEVGLIVEHRLVPIGDIFFRDTILPEEKRRLIAKGQVPRELVEARLADEGVPAAERKVLEQQLRYL